jgi:hypothetical protein
MQTNLSATVSGPAVLRGLQAAVTEQKVCQPHSGHHLTRNCWHIQSLAEGQLAKGAPCMLNPCCRWLYMVATGHCWCVCWRVSAPAFLACHRHTAEYVTYTNVSDFPD